ncbi:hypothetical protein LWP59_01020 [Amycolatopsis acidiphila]|uniref:hypothetical protein n=1 Tax=Amycolatopsis acidiphila TaxID=715473 RepID=UPI001643F027|nr:hypothetical protein [Amycolatopsis acidiphila]UIJ60315.1 hypothetical protein LWP59_01020 [Amycolatopsis acidiphila]GHG90733.1 hypothetical protein GCM10017788_66630 [Amycolatopsis acidiphila]
MRRPARDTEAVLARYAPVDAYEFADTDAPLGDGLHPTLLLAPGAVQSTVTAAAHHCDL